MRTNICVGLLVAVPVVLLAQSALLDSTSYTTTRSNHSRPLV
jgi:hypothetical protein